MCKLSIIVPVYNKKKYLYCVLESIRQQEFNDFECILVDDGSTDGSQNICDVFSKKDTRFITVHMSNSGVSNARNTGLMRARGKYITFIDADDSIDIDYLKKLVDDIENTGADFVITGMKKYWEDTNNVEYLKTPINGLYTFKEILPQFAEIQLKTGIFGFCCGKIFKKEIANNIFFDVSISLAEDFDFYLKIYSKVKKVYFDAECFYGYLQESSNNSVKSDNQIDYLTQLKINLRYREFLKCMNSYSNNNQNIIDSRVNDYIYFVILYSNRKNIKNNVTELYKLINNDDIITNSNLSLKSIILWLIKFKRVSSIKFVLCIYDFLRQFRRR
ncbi:glycosyltransferase family 2 protein [Catenibacterium mitsuokai]|uniref:glycosyltransferase family 2 protein n=1 Tax=Catenibacterium mitsuokai TaxID=100886 RepID=UPI003CFDB316